MVVAKFNIINYWINLQVNIHFTKQYLVLCDIQMIRTTHQNAFLTYQVSAILNDVILSEMLYEIISDHCKSTENISNNMISTCCLAPLDVMCYIYTFAGLLILLSLCQPKGRGLDIGLVISIWLSLYLLVIPPSHAQHPIYFCAYCIDFKLCIYKAWIQTK